jgi:glyoxylase-like metal-dependent hydrolase (beta-lactamase superfamily II)
LRRILAVAAVTATAIALPVRAQIPVRPHPFTPITERTVFPVRRVGAGVYVVPGDTGKGVEGRPNAGFVVTSEGVVAIGGVASPAQGRALLRTIRSVTRQPVRYLVLYAHHPDMHFGAIEFRRVGAKIIAHPDRRVLARDAGDDAMLADWARVVGITEMLGFAYADTPDVPVTGRDTLSLGATRVVVWHPGAAHSVGDLMVWLPEARVLFTGDIVVADGVTMVTDGSSAALLQVLDSIDAVQPRLVIPGHGAVPVDPAPLLGRTRSYITTLRLRLRTAVEAGTSMKKAMADLPPLDEDRAVSLPSRLRRNAARVYAEMERDVMGMPGGEP